MSKDQNPITEYVFELYGPSDQYNWAICTVEPGGIIGTPIVKPLFESSRLLIKNETRDTRRGVLVTYLGTKNYSEWFIFSLLIIDSKYREVFIKLLKKGHCTVVTKI